MSFWVSNTSEILGSDWTIRGNSLVLEEALVIEVIDKASEYLNPRGLLFFPIVSFSNGEKILNFAKEKFSCVERLIHNQWPLPKDMYQHIEKLEELRGKGLVSFENKFGMALWFTDIYVAYNL